MLSTVLFISFFTMIIHLTESLAYSLRLAGFRTKQIAVALSFVTSTLLVSRLSNMFQAPFIGFLVDSTVLLDSGQAVSQLQMSFRIIIFAASVGVVVGMFLTPTILILFKRAIELFKEGKSIPGIFLKSLNPKTIIKILHCFKLPSVRMFLQLKFRALPKAFLVANIIVGAIHCIGVLSAMLAGAMMPEFRSTAIQLSGIVNGIATISLTLFVDPPGARITDDVLQGRRPEADLRSVVFFMQLSKLIGVAVFSQLLFVPMAHYVLWVTRVLIQWGAF